MMHDPQFEVRIQHCGSAARLHLSGELDIDTVHILESWFAHVEEEENSAITVDLKELTFMDASGLRLFLGAADRASRSSRSFEMVNPPAIARRILEITKTTFLIDSSHDSRRALQEQKMSDQARQWV